MIFDTFAVTEAASYSLKKIKRLWDGRWSEAAWLPSPPLKDDYITEWCQ